MIAVVDYGGGNLGSLISALRRRGAEFLVTSDAAEVANAGAAILPGDGAFGATMAALHERGLDDAICKGIAAEKPFLGICVGMQVLYERSEEFGTHYGLGALPGTVSRFQTAPRVPHMGWNQLELVRDHPFVAGLGADAYAYFLHSFRADVDDATLAACTHGERFSAIVARGNIMATQFHPEKSQRTGALLLDNFISICAAVAGMLIVPAIDLRAGRCVRLVEGDPNRETRYDSDPVTRARAFVAAGARRIHVVDLDGAFGTGENIDAFRAICAGAGVPVQTGGGIRTYDDARARFDAGASFVVLGTVLAENPHVARSIVDVYGDRIYAGIDARGDDVKIRGWQAGAEMPRDEFVREMHRWGIPRVVYTEIARDGAGTGYDVDALAHVASLTPMSVTASGGAKTLDDLRALLAGTPTNVDHAIVGRALYDGTIDLAEAIALATQQTTERAVTLGR